MKLFYIHIEFFFSISSLISLANSEYEAKGISKFIEFSSGMSYLIFHNGKNK